MNLSEASVEEFIRLWEEESGEILTPDDARYVASRFLELCLVLMEPLPSEADTRNHPTPCESLSTTENQLMSAERQILSLTSQLRENEERLGREESVEIVGVYEESMSAKTPGRPDFNEMLQRIENGEADAISVWLPNRLARNSLDGARIMDLLDRGVLKHLIFASYNFENTAQGKFFLSILFGEAKYYSDNLSHAVKMGNRTKVKRGWMPRRAPLGYLNHQREDEQRIIIADPERFELVQEMWRLLLTGAYSPPQIWRVAHSDWKLTTPKRKKIGGKLICLATVYRIFHNPFYAGLIPNEGKLYPGKHPAMVTVDEFERVQALITKQTNTRKQHQFAYTGLIRCGECGYAITAEQKTNRYGSRYVYYHCTKKHPSYRCRQGFVQEKHIEASIREFLGSLVVPQRIHEWATRELRRLVEEQQSRRASVEESLKKRRFALTKERDNLTKMCRRELLSEEEYLTQRQDIDRELVSLEQRLQAPQSANRLEPHELLISFSNQAVSWFDEGDATERRLIFEIAGSNPTLMERKLSIEATSPLQAVPKRTDLLSLCGFVEAIETDLANDDQQLFTLLDKLRELKASQTRASRTRPPAE